MTQREYRDWMLYWATEPWGPWRDNLHAALICREVQRPQLKEGHAPKMEHFMYQRPAERKADGMGKVISLLAMLAKKKG